MLRVSLNCQGGSPGPQYCLGLSDPLLFRRNRLALAAQAIPPIPHFTVAWSVVCHIRAPCLNRSTDFDWQVQLWGPVKHCVRWGSLTPRRWEIWGRTPSQNEQLPVLCCPLANTNEKRYRLLPNYFGPCFSLVHSEF